MYDILPNQRDAQEIEIERSLIGYKQWNSRNTHNLEEKKEVTTPSCHIMQCQLMQYRLLDHFPFAQVAHVKRH